MDIVIALILIVIAIAATIVAVRRLSGSEGLSSPLTWVLILVAAGAAIGAVVII